MHTDAPLMCVCMTSVVSDSFQPRGLLCPWDSPGKSTPVGCRFLLQGIFPTQGLKLGVLLSPELAGRFRTTWEALKNRMEAGSLNG